MPMMMRRGPSGATVLALAGLGLQVLLSYINAGYRDPTNLVIVGFAISFLAAAGIWLYRVLTGKGSLGDSIGGVGYALAAGVS